MALLAVGLIALTGCSGSDDPAPVSAADRLAAARARADAASSVHLVLTSKDVPDDAAGVLGADGSGTHEPAFKGTLKARIRGIEADVDVVAIKNDLYLKLPFTGRFAKTDPSAYQAPNPAQLFAPDVGVTSMLPATTDAAEGEQTRRGSEVLTTITGKLPGQKVVDLLHTGDAGAAFDVSYGISDADELRTATVTGPFFGSARSTYEVVLDRYGEHVEITPP